MPTSPPPEVLPEVLAEAERLAARGFDRGARQDYTSWWTCTIDDPHSHDLDDALSIRATIDGGWELAIHIADPSAFVARGSLVDDHAAARATSIYLPTGVHPMFPRALSEDAMSLVAGSERPALTLRVEFDEYLELVDSELTPSVIRVDRRLSYDEVDRMLDDHHDRSHAAETLGSLRYIADELAAAREEAGAVAIQFPQARLDVTLADGEPHVELVVIEKSVARSVVEEMMVFVGDRVARMCCERGIPVPYRAQERPDTEPSDPRILALPNGWAREFAVLCGMKKGEVSLVPRPHAGLGLPISREDAALHGGSLQAWGRPGEGSEFVLTLPRTVPSAGEQDGGGGPAPLIRPVFA